MEDILEKAKALLTLQPLLPPPFYAEQKQALLANLWALGLVSGATSLKQLSDLGFVDQTEVVSLTVELMKRLSEPQLPLPSAVLDKDKPPDYEEVKEHRNAQRIPSFPLSVFESKEGRCQLECRVRDGELSMLWCEVRLQFFTLKQRSRLVILLLDRSGSMKGDWTNVVESVQAVLTPDLLSDPLTTLKIVVYATEAEMVDLPQSPDPTARARLICEALEKHRPTNETTSFSAAFQKTNSLIFESMGENQDSLDVMVLLFTDGQDTSVWKGRRVDPEASAQSARASYDMLRSSLRQHPCELIVYVCAYTEGHDPKQCEYFSDKYQYIDRACTLSAKLALLMGEMTSGGGFCQLGLTLPPGFTLAEPIPNRLSLHEGSLVYQLWIKKAKTVSEVSPILAQVMGTAAGVVPLQCSLKLSPVALPPLPPSDLASHQYVLDELAYRLRAASRQVLASSTVSAEAVAELKALLASVRDNAAASRVAAGDLSALPMVTQTQKLAVFEDNNSSTAVLSSQDRASLVIRLKVIDTLADRISHLVGEFAQGTISQTRIQAILSESRQNLPLPPVHVVPESSASVPISSISSLAVFEELSEYGQQSVKDALREMNADQAVRANDALFFYHKPASSADSLLFEGWRLGSNCVSLKAYKFLQAHSTRGTPVCMVAGRGANSPEEVAALSLPCYFTRNHFAHALALYPTTVRASASPLESLQVCSSMLGASLLEAVAASWGPEGWLWLLHQLRALWQLAQQQSNASESRVGGSSSRISAFIRSPLLRSTSNVPCLVALVTESLLYAPTEERYHTSPFSKALYPELLRRMAATLSDDAVTKLTRRIYGYPNELCASVAALASHLRAVHGSCNLVDGGSSSSSCTDSKHSNSNLEDKKEQTHDVAGGVLRDFSNLVNGNDAKTDNHKSGRKTKNTDKKSDDVSHVDAVASGQPRLQVDIWRHMLELRRRWFLVCERFGGVDGVFHTLDCAMMSEDSLRRYGIELKSTDAVKEVQQIVDILCTATNFAAPRDPVISSVLQGVLLRDPKAYTRAVSSSAASVIQRAFRYKKDTRASPPGGPSVGAPLAPSSSALWVSPYRESAWLRLCVFGLAKEIRATRTQQGKRDEGTAARRLAIRARRELWKTHLLAYHPPAPRPVSICMGMRMPSSLHDETCWSCGQPLSAAHVQEVWGGEAQPDDQELYRLARSQVLHGSNAPSLAVEIAPLHEKRYKALGGTYTFQPGDTFVRGLHQRVSMCYNEYVKLKKQTQSEPVVLEAIEEVCSRLRWDSRRPSAKIKLVAMVRFLWQAHANLHTRSVSTLPTALESSDEEDHD